MSFGDERPRKADIELVNYVSSIATELQQKPDSVTLLNAAFTEMRGHEASLSSHKTASLSVEALVSRANGSQLSAFLANLRPYYGYLAYQRFGSHVLQAVFVRAAIVLANADSTVAGGTSLDVCDMESDDGTDSLPSIDALVLEICAELDAHEEWWPLSFDICATHWARTLLGLLGGRSLPKSQRGSGQRLSLNAINAEECAVVVPPSFGDALRRIVVSWASYEAADIVQLAMDANASPTLQVLLLTSDSSNYQEWIQLARLLIVDGGFLNLAEDKVGSHVLEVLIACSPKHFITEIFEAAKGNYSRLAHHRFANFVLQRILSVSRKESEVLAAVNELQDEISMLISSNRLGVVWKLLEACVNVPTTQKMISQATIRGVRKWLSASNQYIGTVEGLLQVSRSVVDSGSSSNLELETKVSSPTPKIYKQRVGVSILGARSVEQLLLFRPEYCRAVVESILSIDTATLVVISNDPIGGRALLETLLESSEANGWAKKRLIEKFRGTYSTLAANRFGAHVLRKMFNAASPDAKGQLVGELVASRKRIECIEHGPPLLKYLRMDAFLSRGGAIYKTRDKRKKNAEAWLVDMKKSGRALKRLKTRKKKTRSGH